MGSERKIEKVLRAYAKKRRSQAGDPLKLHPATRRWLQGEVARRAFKPEDEDASVTLCELFRQRWAVLVGFAVIIFFGAALFLPALNKAKFKAQKVAAMNNLKEIGLAAYIAASENHGNLPVSLEDLSNELDSAKALTDPQTGKLFIYLAGGENLGQLSSNSVLVYSPAGDSGHAVLFADGRVELINGQRFSELTNRDFSQLLASDNAASRQLAEAPEGYKKDEGVNVLDGMLAAKFPAAAPPALSQPASFVQSASNVARNSFKNILTLGKTSPVLASFQVQQNGNSIRVVDADGSVYEGSLQSAMPAPAAAEPVQDQPQRKISTGSELQTAQTYFFRVAGLNQTLKQKVDFAGNLLAMPAAATNAGLGGGEFGANSPSSPTSQLPWSNSRIAGTAVVADTNNIQINAVPLAP
jgi:hypothetical protein